jgi:hypothetical protein
MVWELIICGFLYDATVKDFILLIIVIGCILFLNMHLLKKFSPETFDGTAEFLIRIIFLIGVVVLVYYLFAAKAIPDNENKLYILIPVYVSVGLLCIENIYFIIQHLFNSENIKNNLEKDEGTGV